MSVTADFNSAGEIDCWTLYTQRPNGSYRRAEWLERKIGHTGVEATAIEETAFERYRDYE